MFSTALGVCRNAPVFRGSELYAKIEGKLLEISKPPMKPKVAPPKPPERLPDGWDARSERDEGAWDKEKIIESLVAHGLTGMESIFSGQSRTNLIKMLKARHDELVDAAAVAAAAAADESQEAPHEQLYKWKLAVRADFPRGKTPVLGADPVPQPQLHLHHPPPLAPSPL